MHIATNRTAYKRPGSPDLPPGRWLCEDLTAFEMGVDGERGSTIIEPFYPDFSAPSADKNETLFICNGGYGDMIAITPALRLVPHGSVTIATRSRVHCVFDHLPYAPKLIDYPVALETAVTYKSIVTTEHLQEAMLIGRELPAIDIKARALGVELVGAAARKPEYIVSPDEWTWATDNFPRRHHKRVGIQLQASSPIRTYHPQQMGVVMHALYKRGCELFLFGSPDADNILPVPPQYRDRVRNLALEKLSFRQSSAALKTCDVVLAPDSSLAHVAGALDIPCVVLSAVVDWRLRYADYPSVFTLQSREGCDLAPCGAHPKGSSFWPQGGPCAKAGHCVAIDNIKPERVVREIEKRLL